MDKLLYSQVESEDAEELYEELRWGNAPRYREEVVLKGSKVRQECAAMGDLRALILSPQGHGLQFRKPFPYLVVGVVDKRLYVTGDVVFRLAVEGAFGEPSSESTLYGIHYSAAKGSPKRIYWTHDFEPPELPLLRVDRAGWPLIAGGSYFVAPEGIVG